jgi:hypothetical protein
MPSALRRKPLPATLVRGSANGVNKSKRTPKLGKWSIPKKHICMSHGTDNTLRTIERKRKSGMNTPRGIVPYDPSLPTPIDTDPMEPWRVAGGSFEFQSPTLLSQENPFTERTLIGAAQLLSSIDDPPESNSKDNMEKFLHLH